VSNLRLWLVAGSILWIGACGSGVLASVIACSVSEQRSITSELPVSNHLFGAFL
jgi:hypothetical protein